MDGARHKYGATRCPRLREAVPGLLIARRLDSLNLNNIFMNEWTRHKSRCEYYGDRCKAGRVHADTWKHERSAHDTRTRY